MLTNRRLITIVLIVFVDLLGFSLILPLLPFYAQTYGASDILVGLLVASYAAAQLVGAPLLGRLSDRYGRRPVLLASILGTFIGFVLLGVARTLWLLFVSRILDGLTGGNISVARAYISDVTGEKDRARGLGMIGAAFGLGFIIGPAAGGLLSGLGATLGEWGRFGLPALSAAALALANLIAVFFILPESLTADSRQKNAAAPRAPLTLQALARALNHPRVGVLLQSQFVFYLAFAMFQTIFALYAARRLGLDARQTAYILSYVGILLVLVQGFLVGRLAGRFRDTHLLVICIGIMAVSLLGWAYAPNVPVLLGVLIPIAASGGVFGTVAISALSKSVAPEEVGGMMGIATSLESVTRVIGPSLGGLLLDRLGASAPGIFGALILTLLVPYAWLTLGRQTSLTAAESGPGEVEVLP